MADEGNNRIDVFEEDGDFLFAFGWGVADGSTEALQSCSATCFKGIAGAGAGQFDRPIGIAVDNISGSPSHHALYVSEKPNRRVQKFDPSGKFIWTIGRKVDKTTNGDLCPKAPGDVCGAGENSEAEGGFFSDAGLTDIFVGVGPAGTVYVLDSLLAGADFKHRLQRFKDTGELIPPQCAFFEGGRASGLAVEAGGGFWVSTEGKGEGIRRYDSSCAQQGEPLDTDIETRGNALALDEAGTLFVAQREAGLGVVAAHKPSGEILRRFGYGKLPSLLEGLAVHNGGESGIFVAPGSGEIVRLNFPPPTLTLPPPGPIAAPPSLEAPLAKIGSTKATLAAEINPEGKKTDVHFDYVDEATYQKDVEELGAGHGFDHAESTSPKALGAEGFSLKAIEAQIGCPNPAIESTEPGNKCLSPETEYRWRVIATNADNPTGAGEGTAEGPPFKTKKSIEIGDTYATGVGTDTARLHAEVNPLSVPASGFFEYVDDADFQASGFAAAIKVPDVEEGQAPLDFGTGEAFLTRSVSIYPLEPGTAYHYRIVADNPLIEAEVGEAEALRTFEPADPRPCPANEAARIGAGALLPDCRAYELVSPLDKAGGDIRLLKNFQAQLAVLEQSSDSGEELAYGSLRSFGDSPSSPYTSQYIAERIAGEEWQTHGIDPPRGRPLFGPTTQTETEFKAFSADLCSGWLTTFAELPGPPVGYVPGFSNLLRRGDRLCGPEGLEALAPSEAPVGVPVGADFLIELQGVSEDGAHAIFTANGKLAGGASEGPRQLYESVRGAAPRLVCILPNEEALGGSCTAGSNTVDKEQGAGARAISSDGERIFWSAPGTGEGKLYVRIGGTQTVAVSKAGEEAAGTGASWFWGAAADGSKAIFSTGNLGEGAAKLYSFDVDSEATSPIAEGVVGVMGMSEDAGRVYFASNKAIGGAGENSEGKEAQAGKANLYLHEAGEGGGTKFIATLAGADLTQDVSSERYPTRTSRVTPDGAHAAFASIAPLSAYDNKGAVGGEATQEIYRYDAETNKLICASCNPSGARPAAPGTIPFFETGMHAARVLSDDGARLYFESPDALAPRDSNGRIDVYQWEEAGTPGCEGADADFAASAEGCVELISSGQSPQDSRFVEASPSGHDVFFATVASLLPQDFGVFDIYDAREGGGLPIPPPEAPPCEGDACHAQVQAPEEPTPSSSNYVGPPEGPSGQSAKGGCPKGKKAARGKGKSRCVAKHKRHHRRAAR